MDNTSGQEKQKTEAVKTENNDTIEDDASTATPPTRGNTPSAPIRRLTDWVVIAPLPQRT